MAGKYGVGEIYGFDFGSLSPEGIREMPGVVYRGAGVPSFAETIELGQIGGMAGFVSMAVA